MWADQAAGSRSCLRIRRQNAAKLTVPCQTEVTFCTRRDGTSQRLALYIIAVVGTRHPSTDLGRHLRGATDIKPGDRSIYQEVRTRSHSCSSAEGRVVYSISGPLTTRRMISTDADPDNLLLMAGQPAHETALIYYSPRTSDHL